jgi:hypothetical protein
MPFIGKGLDVEQAAKELENIQLLYGELTSETLLKAAEPEDSFFHVAFEWNNDIAAHKFRLSQARDIINNVEVVVVSDGEPRQIPVFEIIKTGQSGSYKSIIDMDDADAKQIALRTKKEMIYLRNKLSFYEKFSASVKHLDAAIAELENS